MSKNLVVCCDGTANEFKRDLTSVVKLFRALVKDPARQACYYHPGVGTMAPPGFVTAVGSWLAEVAGLAVGYGLTGDICDAYNFVSRNFEPGDQLYLFGFSRGAYTARSLASLLRMYGLAPSDNDRLAPYIVRMLWAINRMRGDARQEAARKDDLDEYFRLAQEFKATYSRDCKPYFVGVWDTVSSVGWVSNPVALPFTANNGDIAIGRHAVAIDERRAFFRANLWRRDLTGAYSGPKDLKQVWFPGVHSDVGGGYPEAESGLAKLALQWMIDEARRAGLLLEEDVVSLVLGRLGDGYVTPDPNACMHNSMSRAWGLVEGIPKPHWDRVAGKREWRANRARPRSFPEKPVIHDAAWLRGPEYAARLPADAIRLSQAQAQPDLTDQFSVIR
jgi:uncharacterized protein (DUF2235 family)